MNAERLEEIRDYAQGRAEADGIDAGLRKLNAGDVLQMVQALLKLLKIFGISTTEELPDSPPKGPTTQKNLERNGSRCPRCQEEMVARTQITCYRFGGRSQRKTIPVMRCVRCEHEVRIED